jgi:opacity protein-like surface antigen
MARKTITMAALAATVVTAMVPAAAMAQDRYHGGYYGYDQRQGDWQRRGDDRREWRDDRGYDRRPDGYAQRGYDRPVRYAYRGDRGYYSQGGYERGYRAPTEYSYRCQGSGTTGTILGAIAGGLLGNGVAGRGDRTLGTLLGGGAGALAGRAIDKSNSRC